MHDAAWWREYRRRKRDGTLVRKPRRMTYQLAIEVRKKFYYDHTSITALAVYYGCSRQTIGHIVDERTWYKPPESRRTKPVRHDNGVGLSNSNNLYKTADPGYSWRYGWPWHGSNYVTPIRNFEGRND